MSENKKIKIAFSITGLQAGGAERVMSNLANEMTRMGHQTMIVVMKKAVSDYELNPDIRFVGAEASSSGGRNNALKGLLCYIKSIREFKPDIIVSFLPKTIIISMLCKLSVFRKIPVIVGERANPKIRKGIVGKLNDLLFPLADGCVFQTNDARQYYGIKNEDKTCILRNPLSNEFDVERFVGERKKVIVTAGRLYEQKNHLMLIEAFAEVADKHPEHKLIIYGDGPLLETLQNKVDSLGLNGRVTLAGRVDNIKEKIYDASLFVLSSDFEGMPNALLEAMALGLPCVSTDCPVGGPREIINDYENGVLVPVGDAHKMAQAIDKVLSDNELAEKMGTSANKIYNEFSFENTVKQWENFILKIYNNF